MRTGAHRSRPHGSVSKETRSSSRLCPISASSRTFAGTLGSRSRCCPRIATTGVCSSTSSCTGPLESRGRRSRAPPATRAYLPRARRGVPQHARSTARVRHEDHARTSRRRGAVEFAAQLNAAPAQESGPRQLPRPAWFPHGTLGFGVSQIPRRHRQLAFPPIPTGTPSRLTALAHSVPCFDLFRPPGTGSEPRGTWATRSMRV